MKESCPAPPTPEQLRQAKEEYENLVLTLPEKAEIETLIMQLKADDRERMQHVLMVLEDAWNQEVRLYLINNEARQYWTPGEPTQALTAVQWVMDRKLHSFLLSLNELADQNMRDSRPDHIS